MLDLCSHEPGVCVAGQLKRWRPDSSGNPKHSTGPCQDVTDGQVKAVWEELGVGAGGSLNRQELSLVCDHIGLKDLQSEVDGHAKQTTLNLVDGAVLHS